MKATLEFDLNDYDERKAHKRAVMSTDAYLVLHEIGQKIFRPARKHGYGEHSHIQKCIDRAIDEDCDITDPELLDFRDDVVTSAISAMEAQFYALLEEHGINSDDLL